MLLKFVFILDQVEISCFEDLNKRFKYRKNKCLKINLDLTRFKFYDLKN